MEAEDVPTVARTVTPTGLIIVLIAGFFLRHVEGGQCEDSLGDFEEAPEAINSTEFGGAKPDSIDDHGIT
jgi:hypothetical protein